MQPLLTDIKKKTLIIIASLFLSGCSWLNPFLYFQGESGDRSTLPVDVEELIEMAEYCEEAYRSATNENKLITIDGDQISILGVENWASSRFQKYGDLDKAYSGLSKEEFKILLTHNPSHWNAQVTSLYNDIDLTLSGHTHGLQFGIEIGNFRISPARLAYDQWADLYQLNNQSIYVNRGFGFLGYQGRVGILPEITILNLESV